MAHLPPALHARLDRFSGDFADLMIALAAERDGAERAGGRDDAGWRWDLRRLVASSGDMLEQTARFLSAYPAPRPPAPSPARGLRFLAPGAKQIRAASVSSASYDASARTVEVVWTTGAAVLRYDWEGPYVETLDVTPRAVDLGRLNAGAPFLDTHSSEDTGDILGAVVPGSARLQGGQGVATVKLSADPAHAGKVANIAEGVIRNVSVGYVVRKSTFTEATATALAVLRVTEWEPLEISAVPIPADPGAQIRSA